MKKRERYLSIKLGHIKLVAEKINKGMTWHPHTARRFNKITRSKSDFSNMPTKPEQTFY